MSDQEYERREFDRKLRGSLEAGTFLAVNVATKHAEVVRAHLAEHYDIDVWSVDELMLDAMRAVADKRGAKVWATVRKADMKRPVDAESPAPEWRKLLTMIVDVALPRIVEQIQEHQRPLLLVHPGLLARYGRVQSVVERLVSSPSGDHARRAVWMLVAGNPGEHPKIDDQSLPLFQNSQWVDVPRHLVRERTVDSIEGM